MNGFRTSCAASLLGILSWGIFFPTLSHALEPLAHQTPKDQFLAIAKHIKETELSLLHLDRRIRQIQNFEEERKNNLKKEEESLGHVLSTLQRMEHSSPPLLLTKTSDVLETIHRTMLLTYVVPSLKQKMETAKKSVASVLALRAELENLKQETTLSQTQLLERQKNLEKLLSHASKDELLALDSAQEIQRLESLATQSETLTDFIESILPHDKKSSNTVNKSESAASPLQTNSAIPFIHNKGKLPLPVVGTLVRTYGEPDGYGSASKGLSIATRSQALVTAPADGRVLFSGPFRSFQQLLIIDAGHGYHIVLAGMYKVMVARGQFVLSGEPVALMGNIHEQSSVPLTGGAGMPVCYMEIRHGSIPIDPGPWLDQKAITHVTQ